MTGVETLIEALDRLKVETGSLACLGCEHEDNKCRTHGCAILRDAAALRFAIAKIEKEVAK